MGTLLGLGNVLLPVQLLWVNLVTDGLPAMALGFNPLDPETMGRSPRPANEPLVGWKQLCRFLIVGGYVGAATVTGEILAGKDGLRASTVGLSILVVIEMLNAMNSLSETASLFTIPVWRNMLLVCAIFVSLCLHFTILHVSFLARIFHVCPLSMQDWMMVVCLSLPVLFLDETIKAVMRRHYKLKVD